MTFAIPLSCSIISKGCIPELKSMQPVNSQIQMHSSPLRFCCLLISRHVHKKELTRVPRPSVSACHAVQASHSTMIRTTVALRLQIEVAQCPCQNETLAWSEFVFIQEPLTFNDTQLVPTPPPPPPRAASPAGKGFVCPLRIDVHLCCHPNICSLSL